MTRKEIHERKLQREQELISSLKGKKITGKEKDLFRTTSVWKEFRNRLKAERKVDALTGRKLTKTWRCHHERFDSRLYLDLDERYFLCLNNQMHDVVHICVSETIKDPEFMNRLSEIVQFHIKINEGKDIKDFK